MEEEKCPNLIKSLHRLWISIDERMSAGTELTVTVCSKGVHSEDVFEEEGIDLYGLISLK